MKPITKGKISSKLVPDSSHLSALDLHSLGGEALCFGPGNTDRLCSAGVERLIQLPFNPCIQSSTIKSDNKQLTNLTKNYFKGGKKGKGMKVFFLLSDGVNTEIVSWVRLNKEGKAPKLL